jgi:hypothetical protein
MVRVLRCAGSFGAALALRAVARDVDRAAVLVAGLAAARVAGFAVAVTAFRVFRAAGAVRFVVVVAVFTVFVLAVVVAMTFAAVRAETLAVFVGVNLAAKATASSRGRYFAGTAPPAAREAPVAPSGVTCGVTSVGERRVA